MHHSTENLPTDERGPGIAWLFHLYIFKSLTPSQEQQLQNWVDESEGNKKFFETATNSDIVINGIDFLNTLTDDDKAVKRIMEKVSLLEEKAPSLNQKPHRSIYKRWIGQAAAAVLIILAISFMIYKSEVDSVSPGKSVATLGYSNKMIELDPADNGIIKMKNYFIHNENGCVKYFKYAWAITDSYEDKHMLKTPPGGTYSIMLEDSTRVWLNPSSSISYPSLFAEKERKVSITGEAYFEVMHKALRDGNKKPFIVEVADKGVRIEVLGTHFNVSAYTNQPFVITTLIEGSVKISTTGQMIVLKPGEQAKVRNNNINVTNLGIPGAEATMAWKEGHFDFQKGEVKEILNEIARWYDIEVVYKRNDFPVRHFGGSISRNADLSVVLKALEMNGIKLRFEGRKLIIEDMAQLQ